MGHFYVDYKTGDYTITVTDKYDIPEWLLDSIIIHEMVHLYDYYNFPEHFQKQTFDRLRLVEKHHEFMKGVYGDNAVKRKEYNYIWLYDYYRMKGYYDVHNTAIFKEFIKKVNKKGYLLSPHVTKKMMAACKILK